MPKIGWCRRAPIGYEVSTKGDSRFSALNALMPDGRTIEHWYQCDIKGYDPGGTKWRLGKGKPSLYPYAHDQLYELYLSLWRLWSLHHIMDMQELYAAACANGFTLTDCFASSPVNQARALAQILTEWYGDS
jgi:hypothetical protein